MQCPRCQCSSTQVIDSRDSADGIRRRRHCPSCLFRFTTYERWEPSPVFVEKRDGSKERFDPEKIRKGVHIACKNRHITFEQVQTLVETVTKHIYQRGEDTISSRIIGQLVERELKQLDKVAYLRFASVHESFETPEAFTKAITSL